MRIKLSPIFVLILLLLTVNACRCSRSSTANNQPEPPAAPLPDDAAVSEEAIRFLEARIKRDPEDMISYNLLAGRYLQRLRETGNVSYLDLAAKAARESLKVLPVEKNLDGFALQAQVEYASHEFTSARDHGKELIQYDPNKLYPYQITADSLLELGDYDQATGLYKKMARLTDGSGNSSLGVETRFARLETLNGNLDKAQENLSKALSIALSMKPPPRELVAWYRWQLGEVAFAIGDYETAEKHYRDSLTTFTDYYRALGSLGRVRAARGDMAGAIEQYERVVKILPDPTFVAALGDLYKMTGREKDANAQYALVEQIGKLSALNGVLYNRNLALFYADHDMKPEEAYTNAQKEYEVRRDIYGADAVAWTALKAGKLQEAQAAIKDALRLNTKDSKLFYHAGMISRAAGDKKAARDYLDRALKLNPQFDPLQSQIAKKALEELGK